jgi:hypothetical protein
MASTEKCQRLCFPRIYLPNAASRLANITGVRAQIIITALISSGKDGSAELDYRRVNP